MSAGEWLAEMMAWAALETWWSKHPRAIMMKASVSDEAIHAYLVALPAHMFRPIADEHRRRVESLHYSY